MYLGDKMSVLGTMLHMQCPEINGQLFHTGSSTREIPSGVEAVQGGHRGREEADGGGKGNRTIAKRNIVEVIIMKDDKQRPNRITCKSCAREMNKGEYVSHLDRNGGICPGNRQLDLVKDYDHVMKRLEKMSDEDPLAGLDKKNGLIRGKGGNHARIRG